MQISWLVLIIGLSIIIGFLFYRFINSGDDSNFESNYQDQNFESFLSTLEDATDEKE